MRDMALDKVRDELVVPVGNFRRTRFLPRALVSLDVEGAMLEAGWLRIAFRPGAARATGETPQTTPRRKQAEP